MCSNLYFLGKRGTLKTAEGVRLVALGGKIEAEGAKSNKYHPTYTEQDARALYGAHTADILITNQWPKGVCTGSKVDVPGEAPEEVQCLADLCATLKPRYHLAPSPNFFYEREPFFHMPTEDAPDSKPITRFISLASQASSQKWIYAFNLDPKAPIPFTVPVGATASPFTVPQKRKAALPSQRDSYRFSHDHSSNPRPRKKARGPPPGPESCFFCLSNPNIATHLIASIGNECYLTTAKGPLPTSDSFPALGFPSHILIIPFTHTPTLNMITDREARLSVYNEMQRYRSALHSMVSSVSNSSLGSVTWEVSRGNGVHIHWQFLPAPVDLIDSGLVDAAFKVEAENLQYPKFDKPASPADPSAEPGDFFRVRIRRPASTQDKSEENQKEKESEGETGEEKELLLPLTPDFRFDLQFGRRVMAKLMQLDNRMNWKDTAQPQDEEERDAEAFKEKFKPFDFSLEE